MEAHIINLKYNLIMVMLLCGTVVCCKVYKVKPSVRVLDLEPVYFYRASIAVLEMLVNAG